MGKGSEHTLLHRKHRNGQYAYEKMLSIISYQVNANQNHNETPLHTHWDGHNQKDGQSQVGKDVDKLEPPCIASGNSAATSEDSLQVLKNLNIELP